MSRVITPREAAEILHSPLTYVYMLLWQGKLVGVKLGKHWQVEEQSVKALLRRRQKRVAVTAD